MSNRRWTCLLGFLVRIRYFERNFLLQDFVEPLVAHQSPATDRICSLFFFLVCFGVCAWVHGPRG